MAYLVFDFETTGLKPGRHEPIQVAALLLDTDMTELGAFEALMRPLRPELASPEALAINGRSLAELASELHPGEVLGQFIEFLHVTGDPVVMVGHNVDFDLEFLRHEEATYGLALPRREVAVDTCTLARVHLEARGVIANSKLATVASHYGIEFKAHDALGDVRATARVLERFKIEAPELVDRAIEGRLLSGLLSDAEGVQPNNAFIASVSSHFSQNGWLSAKQITTLVRIAADGSVNDRGGNRGLKVRKVIFKRGSSALATISPSLAGLYGCPICLMAYPEAAIASEGYLTAEHAPPESLDGKIVCMTCRSCNSTAGSELDVHMARREEQFNFLKGEDCRPIKAELAVEGVSQRGVVYKAGGALMLIGVPKRDHPDAPVRVTEALQRMVQNGSDGASIHVTFQEPWSQTKASAGWIRSAYLIAFATLGYGYIMRSVMDPIRRQIKECGNEEITIPVWYDPEANKGLNSIFLVAQPAALAGVLVKMGRHQVLLPGIQDDESFYQRGHDYFAANHGQVAERVTGKELPWPSKALFCLDLGMEDACEFLATGRESQGV